MSGVRKVLVRKQPLSVHSANRDYYDPDDVSYDYQDDTSPTQQNGVC